MQFIHRRKLEEGIPVLVCEGARGDREYDMCGAADVLCLMEYAADTAYAFPLEGVIPLAENAVGENSLRMVTDGRCNFYVVWQDCGGV